MGLEIDRSDSAMNFWAACLDRGWITIPGAAWPDVIQTDDLYDAYRIYALEIGGYEPLNRIAFTRGLPKDVMTSTRKKFMINSKPVVKRGYNLAHLDIARDAQARRAKKPEKKRRVEHKIIIGEVYLSKLRILARSFGVKPGRIIEMVMDGEISTE